MLLLITFLALWGTALEPVPTPPAGHHTIECIVLDAGHGGKDSGAVSPRGMREKNVTLEVTRHVRDLLVLHGLQVVMTRDTDVFIPLKNRARIANKKNADLFVSIHSNASLNPLLKGFEVYHLSEATDDNALALERAENSVLRLEEGAMDMPDHDLRTILWSLKEAENRRESIRLANGIGNTALHELPIEARRIRSANFYVLKWTECPAVLVETGYGSNYQDENKLLNPRYRQRLAGAIAKGILDFKKQYDATDGFTT